MTGDCQGVIGADAFATAMAAFAPFEATPHLGVAVSGGADSMTLCLLADQWCRQRGGRVTALTVDHGLRDGSGDEAARVGDWLAVRNIEHRALPWRDTKPAAGIQAAARRARYDLMEAWCRAHGVLHLLVGHTRTDQAETFLMRLRHGSGPDGLSGMSAVRELGHCRVLRPLLGMDRCDLEEFLHAAGQAWLTDPSNTDPRFERTAVRELIATGAFAVPALAETAAAYAGVRQVAEAATDRFLADACRLHGAGYVHLDRAAFAAAARDTGRRALARLIVVIGGRAYPPKRGALNDLYESLVTASEVSATLGHCRLRGTDADVLICREIRHLPAPIRLTAGARHLWDGRFLVTTGRTAVELTSFAASSPAGRREILAAAPEMRRIPAAVRQALPVALGSSGVYSLPDFDYTIRSSEADGAADPGVSICFHPRQPLSLAGFCVA